MDMGTVRKMTHGGPKTLALALHQDGYVNICTCLLVYFYFECLIVLFYNSLS